MGFNSAFKGLNKRQASDGLDLLLSFWWLWWIVFCAVMMMHSLVISAITFQRNWLSPPSGWRQQVPAFFRVTVKGTIIQGRLLCCLSNGSNQNWFPEFKQQKMFKEDCLQCKFVWANRYNSDSKACVSLSSNHTSNNLPRTQNQRLLVQF